MKRGHKKIRLALMAAGSVMALAVLVSLFFTSFNFGFVVLLGIAAALFVYGLFFERLYRLKWLNACVLAFGAAFLGLALFLAAYGASDNVTFDEDAVIVLGAGIRGERVTRLLGYRLEKAVEYHEKNPDALIVVTGGQGPGEDITEALAMERYLIERGVSPDKIIKESKATSSYENLAYSKILLDSWLAGEYKTVIITNGYHMYRAAFLAGKLGLDANRFSAGMLWHSVFVNYSRECLAVLKTWVAGK